MPNRMSQLQKFTVTRRAKSKRLTAIRTASAEKSHVPVAFKILDCKSPFGI